MFTKSQKIIGQQSYQWFPKP